MSQISRYVYFWYFSSHHSLGIWSRNNPTVTCHGVHGVWFLLHHLLTDEQRYIDQRTADHILCKRILQRTELYREWKQDCKKYIRCSMNEKKIKVTWVQVTRLIWTVLWLKVNRCVKSGIFRRVDCRVDWDTEREIVTKWERERKRVPSSFGNNRRISINRVDL